MDLAAEVPENLLPKTLDLPTRINDTAMKGQTQLDTNGNIV